MSDAARKVAERILGIMQDYPITTVGLIGKITREIDRQGLYLGEMDWIQLEDGTRRICGARYGKLLRMERVIQMIQELARSGCFDLDFYKDYGVEQRTGWSVSVGGCVLVKFIESLEEALKKAVIIKSDSDAGGKTKHEISEPPNLRS